MTHNVVSLNINNTVILTILKGQSEYVKEFVDCAGTSRLDADLAPSCDVT